MRRGPPERTPKRQLEVAMPLCRSPAALQPTARFTGSQTPPSGPVGCLPCYLGLLSNDGLTTHSAAARTTRSKDLSRFTRLRQGEVRRSAAAAPQLHGGGGRAQNPAPIHRRRRPRGIFSEVRVHGLLWFESRIVTEEARDEAHTPVISPVCSQFLPRTNYGVPSFGNPDSTAAVTSCAAGEA